MSTNNLGGGSENTESVENTNGSTIVLPLSTLYSSLEFLQFHVSEYMTDFPDLTAIYV